MTTKKRCAILTSVTSKKYQNHSHIDINGDIKVQNQGSLLSENDTEYLLCLALDIGEGMLKNGAEVSRVEDTIERICKAYGAAHVEVFSIISFIHAGVRMPDGSYSSQLRRVRSTGTNLSTLERLNSLSREICKTTPPLAEFDEKIHELKKQKGYPTWFRILASAVAVGSFCVFFGGSLIDALIAAFAGVAISLLDIYAPKRVNAFAKTVLSAFLASMISALAVIMDIGANPDFIIIGAIMLLVQGLAFGTALRDLLCGDLLTGTLKTLQALLGALMIAFGYMLAASLTGDLITSSSVNDGRVWIELAMSILTACSYALMFNTNKKHLLYIGLGGLGTYAVYYVTGNLLHSLFWAAFISTAFTALFSEIMARVRKAPVIIFLLPGIVPTVPGGSLYYTMRNMVLGDLGGAFAKFSTTINVGLGIAGGIVCVSIVFGTFMDWIAKRKKLKSNS